MKHGLRMKQSHEIIHLAGKTYKFILSNIFHILLNVRYNYVFLAEI